MGRRPAPKGKLAGGEKLTASGGRHIRLKDGKPIASDGPYAEAKDVVGGYFVIEAKDPAEAETITKDCPYFALRLQLGRIPPDRRHEPGARRRELTAP